jgi:hypothetical protein
MRSDGCFYKCEGGWAGQRAKGNAQAVLSALPSEEGRAAKRSSACLKARMSCKRGQDTSSEQRQGAGLLDCASG